MSLTLPKRDDLLARAYIDMLAADEGANGGPLLRGGDPDDPIEKLIDDLATVPEAAPRTSVRPDLAAAAVLVARAVDSVEGLTRELRRSSPVISIATHTPETVALVRQVMKICSFGNDVRVLDEKSFDDHYTRSVLLIARDGTALDHRRDKGNEAVARALQARAPTVGVAPDPSRYLPRDLLRAAEHHLSLPRLDASAIRLVIEAVTGKTPTVEIDDELVRAVEAADLALSIRSDRTAEECVSRLKSLISAKRVFDHSGPGLEDLAGYGVAREVGLNLAADLAALKAGVLEWNELDNTALLLSGPPGVGKTQFARALAKSCNSPLVTTSVAEWMTANYLSGSLAAMTTAFQQARQLAPGSILFIDELDGISAKSNLTDHREFWLQIVNRLLELLSSVDRQGVIVIGATNYPDRIDPAIRRAGRMDREIEIPLPSTEDLVQIFRFHLGPDTLTGVDLTPAALAGAGGSGADVEAWVRRAKSRARRAKRSFELTDLLHEVRSGREGLPPHLRRVCAIHEAGHLAVGVALDVFEPRTLTIMDDGGAARVDMSTANSQTESGLENFIASLLAGRAAEEVLLGAAERTAGSGIGDDSDFARASRLAIDLEVRLGFGIMGVAHLPDRATDLLLQDRSVLARIKERLDRCLSRARDVVATNRTAIEAIAERLESTGYLHRGAIDEIVRKHPIRKETAK